MFHKRLESNPDRGIWIFLNTFFSFGLADYTNWLHCRYSNWTWGYSGGPLNNFALFTKVNAEPSTKFERKKKENEGDKWVVLQYVKRKKNLSLSSLYSVCTLNRPPRISIWKTFYGLTMNIPCSRNSIRR